MARARTKQPQQNVGDYRHKDARRRNNPPAGIAPTYEVRERKVQHYAYDPHLDPQLQWAGKAERTSFDVDVVSLHIHERTSTRAVLEAVKRPEPQIALFGEPQLPLNQQIQFYQHDVNWANRLILGDSLLVMNSLLVNEGMAGKVQMIYVDPPYGIKYSSNFQRRTDRRDLKDRDEDLTHEPEQIKAYRDTWKLGIHSYVTYLRDRLLLARELLAEDGSIFLQISDENLHLVRTLLDEVFGNVNFCAQIDFVKTTGQTSTLPAAVTDHLLWYAKHKPLLKFRPLFMERDLAALVRTTYHNVELADGFVRPVDDMSELTDGARALSLSDLTSQTGGPGSQFEFQFQGGAFRPKGGRGWRTNAEGLN